MVTSNPQQIPAQPDMQPLPISTARRWTMPQGKPHHNSAIWAGLEEYNPAFNIGPAMRTVRSLFVDSLDKENDFDVFQHIPEGLRQPQFYGAYLKANSPEEVDQITSEIQRHLQNQQILSEHGIMANLGIGLVAGITDPIQWMLPGKALFNVVKAGKNISVSRTAVKFGLAGMASNIPSEIALQAGNPIITAEESVYGTVAAGMLSGMLGIPVGMIARSHTRLMNDLADDLKSTFTPDTLRQIQQMEGAARAPETPKTYSIPELGVVDGVDLVAQSRRDISEAQNLADELKVTVGILNTAPFEPGVNPLEGLRHATSLAKKLREQFPGPTRQVRIQQAGPAFNIDQMLEIPAFINLDKNFDILGSAARQFDDLKAEFASPRRDARPRHLIQTDIETTAANLRQRFPGPTTKVRMFDGAGGSIEVEIPKVLDETNASRTKTLYVRKRHKDPLPTEISEIVSMLENPAYRGSPALAQLTDRLQARAAELRKRYPGPTRTVRITNASGSVIEIEIPRALSREGARQRPPLTTIQRDLVDIGDTFRKLDEIIETLDPEKGTTPGEPFLPSRRRQEVSRALSNLERKMEETYPGPRVKKIIGNKKSGTFTIMMPKVLDDEIKSLFGKSPQKISKLAKRIPKTLDEMQESIPDTTPPISDIMENFDRLDFETLESLEDFMHLKYGDVITERLGINPKQKLLPSGGQDFLLWGSKEHMTALNPYTMGRLYTGNVKHLARIANDSRWWPIVPRHMALPPAVRNGVLERQKRMTRFMRAVFTFPGELVNEAQTAATAKRLEQWAAETRARILESPELSSFVADADTVMMYLLSHDPVLDTNLPVTFNRAFFDNATIEEIVSLQARLDESINRFTRAAALAIESEANRTQTVALARHFGQQVTDTVRDIRLLKDRLLSTNNPEVLDMQPVERHGVTYYVSRHLLYDDSMTYTPDGVMGAFDEVPSGIGISKEAMFPTKTAEQFTETDIKNLFKANGFEEMTETFGEGFPDGHRLIVIDQLGRKMTHENVKTSADMDNLLEEMGLADAGLEQGLIRGGAYMSLRDFKDEFIEANLGVGESLDRLIRDAEKAIESPTKASRMEDPLTIQNQRRAQALKRAKSMRRVKLETLEKRIADKEAQISQAQREAAQMQQPADIRKAERKIRKLETDLDAMNILKERKQMFPDLQEQTTGQKIKAARAEARAREMRQMTPEQIDRRLELSNAELSEQRKQLKQEPSKEIRSDLRKSIEELETERNALRLLKEQSSGQA